MNTLYEELFQDHVPIYCFEHPLTPPEGFNTALVPLERIPPTEGDLFFNLEISYKKNLLSDEELEKDIHRIEHFFETVSPVVASRMKGIVIGQIPIDLTPHFHWNAEIAVLFSSWLQGNEETPLLKTLFCRDMFFDYLTSVLGHFLDQSTFYICLDASSCKDPLNFLRFTARNAIDPYVLIVKNAPLLTNNPVWQSGNGSFLYLGSSIQKLEQKELPSIGVYIPSDHFLDHEELVAIVEKLSQEQIPFRSIHEEFLTTEWDGLDFLIVSAPTVSIAGRRKLAGFVAASGKILYAKTSLELEGEESFTEWYQSQ